MTIRAWLAAVTVTLFTVGCGSNPKPQVALPAPPPPAPAEAPLAQQLPVDPILTLIAESRTHYDAGERELRMGHLERARAEFDRAVTVLLESPYGARTDARMREHFDRLVDRINAHEVTALAQGDGFSETRSEPASLDELLQIAMFAPPAGTRTWETVRADLASNEHDVDIPQNERVLSYVELFQGRLRDYIHSSLERGSQYLPMIFEVFEAEGLPLDLAFIPIIESGFKNNALSKASAKGPWQFMAPTAREVGLRFDWYVDERSDPEKSTIAAAKYLKTLSRMFDGDWHLVLAAYNGGLGRLQRAMKAAGTDDFWKLSASTRYLPKETREYVPMILAAMIVGRNPAQYGFEVAGLGPFSYEKVTVPDAIDLRRVAEWTGASIDEIRALNPELRRWTTPVKTQDFTLKVPVGTAEQFEARLAGASPAEFSALAWHTVKRGETLAAIAQRQRTRVSVADLAAANGLTTRSRLTAGQQLVIPNSPSTLLATRTERAAPAQVASRSIAGSAAVPTVARPPSPIVYQVKRGDTLSGIARLFDTTVDQIKSWNKLRTNAIVAGARLTIHSSRAQ
ncbi:MAG: LysM peptidoglycan-binding domain-containing protein [Acidobacteria bacterium]|nr:LysM peptidoglycan-binding domain-containing protein [Acidobacteriota bacterium]